MKFKIVTILIFLLNLAGCKEKDDSPSLASSVNAKINGINWTGEGSYFIAFGNDPQLFSITCRNDTSQFNMEFRANGIGTYSLMENGFYFSHSQQTIYKITSASVSLNEVTTGHLASGIFNFEAENTDGSKKVVLTQGKFDKVKGSGYW